MRLGEGAPVRIIWGLGHRSLLRARAAAAPRPHPIAVAMKECDALFPFLLDLRRFLLRSHGIGMHCVCLATCAGDTNRRAMMRSLRSSATWIGTRASCHVTLSGMSSADGIQHAKHDAVVNNGGFDMHVVTDAWDHDVLRRFGSTQGAALAKT